MQTFQRAIQVSRSDLSNYPKPLMTQTYRPIGHDEMVDLLSDVAEEAHLRFGDERYELSVQQPRSTEEDPTPEKVVGNRFFGKWELTDSSNGCKMMIGMRNSYDSSMSFGICAGTKVIVCSNMMFTGDFVALRKHTVGLSDDDLRRITMTAIIKIIRKAEHLSNWHRALKTMEIDSDVAMSMLIEGFERKVYPASKLRHVLNAYRLEKSLSNGDTTLYTILGAFTRLYKDSDLFSISKHTAIAEQMLDEKVVLRQRSSMIVSDN